MIPKVIHFCWLSDEKYPEKIDYCIKSWKKKCPDYEIIKWDLKRFDIESSHWVKEAFNSKKYAFAADFIRCYALYNYGGIYLDSDVECLSNFDRFLSLPYFIGKERGNNIEAAVMGAEKGNPLMEDMIEYYKDRNFILPDGSMDMLPLPIIMDNLINKKYHYNTIADVKDFKFSDNTMNVFTADFFSPKYPNSFKCPLTHNTVCIHHFEASWYSNRQKIFRMIRKLFGSKVALFASKIKRNL